jgi:hypothetical protein
LQQGLLTARDIGGGGSKGCLLLETSSAATARAVRCKRHQPTAKAAGRERKKAAGRERRKAAGRERRRAELI